MKIRRSVLFVAVLTTVLHTGCVGVPEGVQTVTGFELNRFLGTWYEIARLDHRFERGMSNVTATYSMRDDGVVRVVNNGYETENSEWNEAIGKATFVGDANVGQLKVSFFGPFYGGYNIIELDKENYQYALVSGADRGSLWILARTPKLENEVLSTLVSKAQELDFPTDELIYVDHTTPK